MFQERVCVWLLNKKAQGKTTMAAMVAPAVSAISRHRRYYTPPGGCLDLCCLAGFHEKNHHHHREVVAATLYHRRPPQVWLCVSVCVCYFVCVSLFGYCV